MSVLEVTRVSKAYGGRTILSEVTFRVDSGFYALLGPSGSGKTTILRMVAGFVSPDLGTISIDGQDVSAVQPYQRDIGFVFQHYALFPHMTVFRNVAFGLRLRKLPRKELIERVIAGLELAQITHLANRRPQHLSGGEQQRVAVARALVTRPRLLLLDEPLSALDRMIRQSMRAELKRIQRQTGITTLIVTHDQEEALDLADELLVLDRGRVRQVGSPDKVYMQPADPFVASFMGSTNIFDARLVRDGGSWRVDVSGCRVPAVDPAGSSLLRSDQTEALVRLAIRPEYVAARAVDNGKPASDCLLGKVVEVSFSGPVTRLTVDVGSMCLSSLSLSPDAADLRPGIDVDVHLNPAGMRYYPRNEEGTTQ